MYPLKSIYGKAAYDAWHANPHIRDLSGTRTSAAVAAKEEWTVCCYPELVRYVSFLTVMNKRLVLFYRGQSQDWDLLPTIFRDDWPVPSDGPRERLEIRRHREHYWDQLDELGPVVYEICRRKGLPRWRTLETVREAQWAVMQHYDLWPTPLIDLTSSLRVAASFALSSRKPRGRARTGFLYVIGMPNLTGSVTHSVDDQLVLARLNAVCPPVAKRPHLQDGFLVGRFPFYDISQASEHESDLARRLIAKFHLVDDGRFWTRDFPRICTAALLPAAADDELLVEFGNRVAHRIEDGRVEWSAR